MTDFKTVLGEESDFPMSDHIYNIITENAELLTFRKGETLVDIGSLDPDIYIIKQGIVRGYMVNDGVEMNIYFGMDGTLLASMQGYSLSRPSIICIEVCCPTTVLRIRKAVFDRLMEESNEFCRWVCGVFSRRSCFDELKAKVMNGNAKWRYEWLEKCRPELFDNVPLKAIASYLKMTEVHVSRIRKEIAKRGKH
ncbi:MAG: Crp/Fnr family transcriptional regulator [Muribaculaceae bacterium]|nr:Crp/Fnr family transcriptional regulator [Muribaculaceae bacterium]